MSLLRSQEAKRVSLCSPRLVKHQGPFRQRILVWSEASKNRGTPFTSLMTSRHVCISERRLAELPMRAALGVACCEFWSFSVQSVHGAFMAPISGALFPEERRPPKASLSRLVTRLWLFKCICQNLPLPLSGGSSCAPKRGENLQ